MDIKTLEKDLKEFLNICIRGQREHDFVQKLKEYGFSSEKASNYRYEDFLLESGTVKITAPSWFKDTGGGRHTKYSLSISLYENGERIDHHFDSYGN